MFKCNHDEYTWMYWHYERQEAAKRHPREAAFLASLRFTVEELAVYDARVAGIQARFNQKVAPCECLDRT